MFSKNNKVYGFVTTIVANAHTLPFSKPPVCKLLPAPPLGSSFDPRIDLILYGPLPSCLSVSPNQLTMSPHSTP